MDRLANEGVRFTHAHTTAPVCSSSRSAFNIGLYQTFTGTHHHRSHRDDGYQLPHGARLVSERLAEAGYFTANVLDIAPGVRGTGKTDWNWAASKGFEGNHWRERAAGQPFYAQINFQAPHKGPAFRAARQRKSLIDPARVDLPPYYPDHPVIRDEVANYYDAIQMLDTQVGATLDALKADGVLDNTIIFLFGDNGRCLLRGKQWLYDGGTHIPLLARYPGVVPAGQRRDDPVLSLDITAQTLTWAGLPLPKPFHGQNLFGAKARSHIFTARDRCDMTVFRLRTVRDARYRYIRNFTPDRPFLQHNEYKEKQYPVWNLIKELAAQDKLTPEQAVLAAPTMPEEELYDLQTDPHQIKNLAKSNAPEHRAALERLRGVLEQWIEQTNDQGRIPEPAEVAKNEGATKPKSDQPKKNKKKTKKP